MTRTEDAGLGLHGDRPGGADDPDRLGFGDAAAALAAALVDASTRKGFVLGLEGPWGSGKTRLLALIESALTKRAEAPPLVLRFAPWIVGDRDALIGAFFADLAAALRTDAGTPEQVADTTKAIGDYAFRLAPHAARIASALGVPLANVAADALDAASKARGAILPQRSLADLKRDLGERLAAFPRRIVVFIDDLDRLDPPEVMEILRLVRAVADFENVVYVLCYDRDTVAAAVTKAIHMDGAAYLDQIVQATVPVPAPESHDLRRMFAEGLATFARPTTDDEGRRLQTVIDTEAGDRLRTPRAVNRTLDALRLRWPHLRGRVDLADLVWLEVLRTAQPALYRWVRDYMTDCDAVSSGGASFSADEVTRRERELEAAFGHEPTIPELVSVARYVPDVATHWAETKGKRRLFNLNGTQTRDDRHNRRLASPDHWRLYFALTEPRGALTTSDLDALAAAGEGKEAVADLLRRWFRQGAPATNSKAARCIDQLASGAGQLLDANARRNVIFALADVLDEPAALMYRNSSSWAQSNTYAAFRDLTHGLDDAEAIAQDVFREGRALGWLMDVFRWETFAQGRYGDSEQPESAWLFRREEFDDLIAVMHERLARETPERLLSVPNPVSLLFGWAQTGGGDAARDKVAEALGSDEGFVHGFDVLLSGTGAPHPKCRRELEVFLDVEDAERRLADIVAAGGPLAEKARALHDLLRKSRRAT